MLTKAQYRDRVDHLRGLKENVIVGRLIPAVTGMLVYLEKDEPVSGQPNSKTSFAPKPTTRAEEGLSLADFEDEQKVLSHSRHTKRSQGRPWFCRWSGPPYPQ